MRTLLTTVLLLAGCGQDSGATPSMPRREKPLVCTTNYPLQYCVERIAGGLAMVECVVPAGADPLHWRPEREAIARLQTADLIVINGATAEPWRFGASLPLSRVVDTSDGFWDQFIERPGVTHSHGDGKTHTHSTTDPHTWIDPRLLKEQAVAALESLIRRLPDHESALRDNYGALARDLDELDGRIDALATKWQGKTLATSADAYRYLARRGGWTGIDLEVALATEPWDAALAAMRQALGGKRAVLMLWTAPPSAALRERITRDLDVQSVVFSTGAAVPDAGGSDYLSVMRANLERLARAFEQ
ncbi:MAG: metal ABC transporter substrate-binding protein [bacterium]|nr:metal ABC transporter substrate-binding protein [bacterium]